MRTSAWTCGSSPPAPTDSPRLVTIGQPNSPLPQCVGRRRVSNWDYPCQVYSSLDLSRGHLEEKGEAEEKKSESPLTVDSLSWTPDFADV